MSAPEVTEKVTAAIRSRKYGLIVLNFANCDMVGHTGSIPAAVQAVETVDRCLSEVLAAAEEAGMAAVITADHGNADEMLAEDGGPKTSHTTNPVPLWVTVPGLGTAFRRTPGRPGSHCPGTDGTFPAGRNDRHIADCVKKLQPCSQKIDDFSPVFPGKPVEVFAEKIYNKNRYTYNRIVAI